MLLKWTIFFNFASKCYRKAQKTCFHKIKSMAQTKVFHLEMDGEHYYFGSPKAIFDIMGEEKMGMKYASFHSNITLSPGDVYTNRRKGYTIRVGLLGQAKTNRGNRWQEIISQGVQAALRQHATEAPVPAQDIPQQTESEAVTHARPEPSKPRGKKKHDNPQQLTLF